MKYAFTNGIILDGTKNMEPLEGKTILVSDDHIVDIIELLRNDPQGKRTVCIIDIPCSRFWIQKIIQTIMATFIVGNIIRSFSCSNLQRSNISRRFPCKRSFIVRIKYNLTMAYITETTLFTIAGKGNFFDNGFGNE